MSRWLGIITVLGIGWFIGIYGGKYLKDIRQLAEAHPKGNLRALAHAKSNPGEDDSIILGTSSAGGEYHLMTVYPEGQSNTTCYVLYRGSDGDNPIIESQPTLSCLHTP